MPYPIRVAQIMGKLMSGGVEMVVFNYYRAIDKTKIQFDFFYDEDSVASPPEDLISMGARFIKIPPYQNIFQYMSVLKKYFKENKYRIVHSHLNTLSVFPLFVAWRCSVPYRIAHNHSVPCNDHFVRTFIKNFLRLGACLFSTDYYACSERAGRWLFGNKKFDSGKVVIIKNAIDFSRFNPSSDIVNALKKKFNLENKFVVGHIGRFTHAKNHIFLIDIFKHICEIRNDAVLLLVGDGELSSKIHKAVRDNELENRVIFTGRVLNPEAYYRLSNVMVFPSVFEGMPLVAIESQVSGIPVVASKAIPEEAIMSNGCLLLDLSSDKWVDCILSISENKVCLDDRCFDYDINFAVKNLEKRYLEKFDYL